MKTNVAGTMRRLAGLTAVLLSSGLLAAGAAAAPALTLGTASGQAGTTVNVPVTFDPTTNLVVGIQFDITVPAQLSTGSITAGPILTAAVKSVSSNLVGNTLKIIIFGLNQNTLAAGSLLNAQFFIAPGAPLGNLSLVASNIVYSDASGTQIAAGNTTNGTVTVAPAPASAPAITSALAAAGQVGAAFSYQITASNSPTSYGAAGLPAGLSVNAGGLISGTPTAAAVSSVTLSATNAGGTGTAALTLTINPSAPAISPCDLNGDGVVNSVDVDLAVDQSKGRLPCTNGDLTLDGRCNVQDVQRVSNAASGGTCKVGRK